jgi:hypothetical protein
MHIKIIKNIKCNWRIKSLEGDMVMPCDRESQDSDQGNAICALLITTGRIKYITR